MSRDTKLKSMLGTNARSQIWLGALAIIAMTFLAYAPAMHAGFIWDDDNYVTRNALMNDSAGWWRCWIPGTTPQYYPMVFTMFWFEHAMWKLNPLGYHMVNVLLHALNAVLVWRLAAKLRIPGAWMIAAVFAMHPVHVESVAWITERKNVLSGSLYLIAALAYLRFDAAPAEFATTPSQGRWRWYAVAIVSFVLALLSKSVTCSLPAALILMMLWQRTPITVRRLAPLLPMFVIGAVLALHTANYERHFVGAQGVHFAFSVPQRVVIASNALLFYPQKLLWPWPVMFIYPRWMIRADTIAAFWPLGAVLAAGAIGLILYLRGKRGPLLAALFFAGTIFPALGFVNVYPFIFSFVADHFQYLASLGIIAMVVGSACSFKGWQRYAKPIATAILTTLGLLTYVQAHAYEDAETVWRDTLSKNDDAWMPHNNLASILIRQAVTLTEQGESVAAMDHVVEAEHHARRSLELRADHPQALNNLCEALRLQGRYAESLMAIQHYVDLLLQRPGDVEIGTIAPGVLESHLAEAYWKVGRLQELLDKRDEALAAYREGVRLGPGQALIQQEYYRFVRKLGDDAAGAGDALAAESFYRELCAAANSDDGRIEAGCRLANVMLAGAAGDPARAAEVVTIMERVNDVSARIRREEPFVLTLLAAAYSRAGRTHDALQTAERALELARAKHLDELAATISRQLESYRSDASQ